MTVTKQQATMLAKLLRQHMHEKELDNALSIKALESLEAIITA